ncbi:hypothetical protein F4778DRAFT_801578 [Xylariomycetidae sp. FL2044]|nr:hypothetical protein F4778DRAFT_801578 [Xylariomycetidae sp. FL2044]
MSTESAESSKSWSPAPTRLANSPPPLSHIRPSRLEEKLDDIASLLRSQAVEKQNQAGSVAAGSIAMPGNNSTTLESHPEPCSTEQLSGGDPDIVIDTDHNIVRLIRPTDPASSSPVFDDVSTHLVADNVAEERLNLFRRVFLSTFPFVHIPAAMGSSELRQRKPFLWLNVMAPTANLVTEQFLIEAIVWRIISRRIVCQHLVDIDLLLGVICFASWSHCYKTDKPFMTMLSQMTISMALEMGLDQDSARDVMQRRAYDVRSAPPRPAARRDRTVEERRTILALFHLTSSTWTAYRKTEPIRWTNYMDTCLRVLHEEKETDLDLLLTFQVACQIITNQITCPPMGETSDGFVPQTSATLTSVLLGQLRNSWQSLPAGIKSEGTAPLYLYSTEIAIREPVIRHAVMRDRDSFPQMRRISELESVLACVQGYFTAFNDRPIDVWFGIDVECLSRLTGCLVVLFRLGTLDEPGWDVDEVRKQVDVFAILDRICQNIEEIVVVLGLIDADGPKRGLFFKAGHLFSSIKVFFSNEMKSHTLSSAPQASASHPPYNSSTLQGWDVFVPEEFFSNLSNEPWFSDFTQSLWET